ncbi:sulfotransferase family 2 domain-containing protein [Pelagibacterales bacterium SAG-MED30]|nr:sulfotransferase family 2 domain-containing protein [Pelagibacterales bacterium SAG-MED30]
MIISKKKKFIFLKTAKTAGSSIEFYLSQFCGNKDTITSLRPHEEKLKRKFNILKKQNYEYKKKKFALKNFKKLNFSKKIVINEHSSLKILEDKIKMALNHYYTFAFVRNPYHWIVSYFWWYLYDEKVIHIKDLNKLTKKEINFLFRLFLKSKCLYFFTWMKDIISSNKYKVHIYKFENLEKNIQQLKSILSLNNEKIKFGEVRLKELSLNLKTKNKLKFTKEDIKVIRKDAKFFFSEYNYSKQVPKIFLK